MARKSFGRAVIALATSYVRAAFRKAVFTLFFAAAAGMALMAGFIILIIAALK